MIKWRRLILTIRLLSLLRVGVILKTNMVIHLSFLNIRNLNINWIFLLDNFSIIFGLVVILISSTVFFYSSVYIREDKKRANFRGLVFLFVISILLLLFSPNLLSLMLGWDGLGLVSFLLVVYYQNYSSLTSGLLTIYLNRFGDGLMLLSLFYLLSNGGRDMFLRDDMALPILMLVLFVAACTKSAQIPFSAWLPAAMAAPTPVSSLVHSSTLVTAGVYLIVRFNSLTCINSKIFFIRIVGLATICFAGVVACCEIDIKKTIAISTLSQLGLIFVFLGIGINRCAFFHIRSHALFKSLLFIRCGLLLVKQRGAQDFRFHGGRLSSVKTGNICFSSACLSLIGFPFLVGFFSKDFLLERLRWVESNFLIYICFFFSCVLTFFYSFRLIKIGLLAPSFLSIRSEIPKQSLRKSFIVLFVGMVSIGRILIKIFSLDRTLYLSPLRKIEGLYILGLGVSVASWKKYPFFSKVIFHRLLFLLIFSAKAYLKLISKFIVGVKGDIFFSERYPKNIRGFTFYWGKASSISNLLKFKWIASLLGFWLTLSLFLS